MTAATPMQLADLLDAYREEDAAGIARHEQAVHASEAAWLRRPGWDDRVPRVGEAAPAVAMPDALDPPVGLPDLARDGPLVVKFYRGRWGPYCTLDLRAWQRVAPDLQALGSRFVAVTPQREEEIALLRERDGLDFHVVSDTGLRLARAFGIDYEVDPALRGVYAGDAVDLAATNASGDWTLPLPACFVIARDGRLVWSHVDTDYSRRAEPADVMAVVRSLVGG